MFKLKLKSIFVCLFLLSFICVMFVGCKTKGVVTDPTVQPTQTHSVTSTPKPEFTLPEDEFVRDETPAASATQSPADQSASVSPTPVATGTSVATSSPVSTQSAGTVEPTIPTSTKIPTSTPTMMSTPHKTATPTVKPTASPKPSGGGHLLPPVDLA